MSVIPCEKHRVMVEYIVRKQPCGRKDGVGNCSVETRTRNHERMDLVIYYAGVQSIIEMKIWRGNAYNERGERQLSD